VENVLQTNKAEKYICSPFLWKLDNLAMIGGHKPIVCGDPRQIITESSRALSFNGLGDGLYIPTHPLQGAKRFTVEILFRPLVGGEKEQRFFHMQEDGSENRVMFETRLVGTDYWFLDTFVKSGDQECTLYAKDFLHRLGPWYHAALVVDDKQMRHYVNGKLEMSTALDYAPQGQGKTSVGMRFNQVYWYRGEIRAARFSHQVLSVDEFCLLCNMVDRP
jgi:hypothetical protein